MKAMMRSVCFLAMMAAGWDAQGTAPTPAKEYYYATEINGTLCGFVQFTTSPMREKGRSLVLLNHEILMRIQAMGQAMESRLKLTYHLDPETGGFTYHDSAIEQGGQRLFSRMRIEDGKAFISGTGQEKEEAVEIPPDVVLENTLFYPHLVRDFAKNGLTEKTYKIFNGRDGKVQEVVYTKVGLETIRPGGKAYETVVLDCLNRTNGLKTRMWLDPAEGIAVQTRMPNRLTYRTDESVRLAIQTAVLDPTLIVKAGQSIPNPDGISFMKIRFVCEPVGLWASSETLTVPGQKFSGTVNDNLIEGVFEIEHRPYDGSGARAFPADFGRDPALKEFLEPSDLIQSADPVLIEKAREIARGSEDAWEAAGRIARWVAQNIKGAIPGGGTARGVYDTRGAECGGYANLTAAFCRAMGIPARVVWGCLYTPSGGGFFAQHGWNEVYMGAAGWIPIDVTRSQFDTVDSGHIRIGIHRSTTTALNPKKAEILDFRTRK